MIHLKSHLLLLGLLFLISSISLGQSKKQLQADLGQLQNRYDSLLASQSLPDSMVTDSGRVAVSPDSLLAQIELLNASQDSISLLMSKVLVLLMDSIDSEIAMANARALMDSVVAHPETYSPSKLRERLKAVQDSVLALQAGNDSLVRTNTSIKELYQFLVGGNIHPYRQEDLIGNWQITLSLVTLEGDSGGVSGLVTHPVTELPNKAHGQVLTKVNLIDNELAELHFLDGSSSRCFYQVKGFHRDNPYYLDLRKLDSVNYRLYVNHNFNGIQISYRLPEGPGKGAYLFGYMRQ